MGLSQKDKVPKQRKCHCEPNVTKLSQNTLLHSKLSCSGVLFFVFFSKNA